MINEVATTRTLPRNVFWEHVYQGVLATLREVRRSVRDSLAGCTDALTDDVEVVVSELAANAVRHSRSGRPNGTYIVRVAHFPTRDVPCVWLEVEDMGTPTWDGSFDLNPMHGFAMCTALTTWLGSQERANGNRVVYARIEYGADGMPLNLPIAPRLLVDPDSLWEKVEAEEMPRQ